MLAEAFILKLEMTLRAAIEPATAGSAYVPFNPATFTGFKTRGVKRLARS